MEEADLRQALRFYFITDDRIPDFSPLAQVLTAIKGGATMIQYRNKSYTPEHLEEVIQIRQVCRDRGIPFLVNDTIELARQVMADGVHLGQEDESPLLAREILGQAAIIGATVSNPTELAATDLTLCDYIGTGPVYGTRTKADAKPVQGLDGFRRMVENSPVPVVAIGGITAENAGACFAQGAAGVAVISSITRSDHPLENATRLAQVCSA